MSELITSFDSKTKTILQLSKESTYLELPEYYNDVEINIIGEGAGYSGKYEIVDLTNSKIYEIGLYAFAFCPIQELLLPSCINTIHIDAFRYTLIEHINLPSSLTNFDGAFSLCRKLVSFYIESGSVFKIIDNIVINTKSRSIIRAAADIVSVNISNFVKIENISCYAFCGCSIESFFGHSEILSIGLGCFEECVNLSSVNLFETKINVIPEYCFKRSSVQNIILPSHVKELQYVCFQGCSFSSIFIPKSVIFIEKNSFSSFTCDLTIFYIGSNSFDDQIYFSESFTVRVYVTNIYPSEYFGNVKVIRGYLNDIYMKQSNRYKHNSPFIRRSLGFIGVFL